MNPNDSELLNFKKMMEADLELMRRWLNTDFVQEWYGKKTWTAQDVADKYLPRITGNEPTDCFIVQYGSIPIGYIQTYLIKDYPDYNQYAQADDHAAGVDLFIGEKDYIHRGLGKVILGKFLQEIVFKNPQVESCIMGPEPKNQAAIKSYEKVGFKYLKTIQLPDDPEPEYLMRIEEKDIQDIWNRE